MFAYGVVGDFVERYRAVGLVRLGLEGLPVRILQLERELVGVQQAEGSGRIGERLAGFRRDRDGLAGIRVDEPSFGFGRVGDGRLQLATVVVRDRHRPRRMMSVVLDSRSARIAFTHGIAEHGPVPAVQSRLGEQERGELDPAVRRGVHGLDGRAGRLVVRVQIELEVGNLRGRPVRVREQFARRDARLRVLRRVRVRELDGVGLDAVARRVGGDATGERGQIVLDGDGQNPSAAVVGDSRIVSLAFLDLIPVDAVRGERVGVDLERLRPVVGERDGGGHRVRGRAVQRGDVRDVPVPVGPSAVRTPVQHLDRFERGGRGGHERAAHAVVLVRILVHGGRHLIQRGERFQRDDAGDHVAVRIVLPVAVGVGRLAGVLRVLDGDVLPVPSGAGFRREPELEPGTCRNGTDFVVAVPVGCGGAGFAVHTGDCPAVAIHEGDVHVGEETVGVLAYAVMVEVEPCDAVDLAFHDLRDRVHLVVAVRPTVHVRVRRLVVCRLDAQAEVVAGGGGQAWRGERPCHRLAVAVGDGHLACGRIHRGFGPLLDLFAGYLRRVHVAPLLVGREVDFDAVHACARTRLDGESGQSVVAVIVGLVQALVGHDVHRIRVGFLVLGEVAQHVPESQRAVDVVQQRVGAGRQRGRARAGHANRHVGYLRLWSQWGSHVAFRLDGRMVRERIVVPHVMVGVGRVPDGGGIVDDGLRAGVGARPVHPDGHGGGAVLVHDDRRRDGGAAGDRALVGRILRVLAADRHGTVHVGQALGQRVGDDVVGRVLSAVRGRGRVGGGGELPVHRTLFLVQIVDGFNVAGFVGLRDLFGDVRCFAGYVQAVAFQEVGGVAALIDAVFVERGGTVRVAAVGQVGFHAVRVFGQSDGETVGPLLPLRVGCVRVQVRGPGEAVARPVGGFGDDGRDRADSRGVEDAGGQGDDGRESSVEARAGRVHRVVVFEQHADYRAMGFRLVEGRIVVESADFRVALLPVVLPVGAVLFDGIPVRDCVPPFGCPRAPSPNVHGDGRLRVGMVVHRFDAVRVEFDQTHAHHFGVAFGVDDDVVAYLEA